MDDKRRRFETEVMPHLDAAYRFARWLSGSPTDAEDVVQDAVLRAFRSFESLRGSDVKAWFLAIVKNCHFTTSATRQRRVSVPLPDESDARDGHFMIAADAGPETAAIRTDELRTWAELLDTLPDEYREVLLLREVEEMGYREIATTAGIPVGTVMSRLARARRALKKRWLEHNDGDMHAAS